VTLKALQDAGTVDKDALATLGELKGDLVTPTAEQAEANAAILASKWASAVS
jgi:putative spermidine/putrescine transport system substrate-binding protein